MIAYTRSLAALGLLGAFLAGNPAEARFGKRTEPESREESHSDDRDHDEHSHGSSRAHRATPAGSGEVVRDWHPVFRSRPRCVDYGCGRVAWVGYGFYPYALAPLPDEAPQGVAQDSQVVERELVLTAGADVQVFPSGATGGLNLLVEGQRWGFGIDYQGIAAGDGTGYVDTIGLFGSDVSYAVLASPHGRVRLDGGIGFASAPDVTFIGPRFGVSGGVALIGSLNLEGAIRVVPFPHASVESWAGFALGFGPLGVRAGYKRIFLDDRGLVDGYRNQDVFSGPYVGLALSL